jgi:hypothetical protein
MKDLPPRSHEEWSHEFWSELVNRTHLLSRRENTAKIFEWSVRLVWDEGRRGTIYLYNPSGNLHQQRERQRFVFTEFEPRREAQLLLSQIAPDRALGA